MYEVTLAIKVQTDLRSFEVHRWLCLICEMLLTTNERLCEFVIVLHCLQSKCQRYVAGSMHSSTVWSQWLTKSSTAAWHCTTVGKQLSHMVTDVHLPVPANLLWYMQLARHKSLSCSPDCVQSWFYHSPQPDWCHWQASAFLDAAQSVWVAPIPWVQPRLELQETQFAIAYDCHLVRFLNDLQNGSAELTCAVLPMTK